jgi:hypothetical protein
VGLIKDSESFIKFSFARNQQYFSRKAKENIQGNTKENTQVLSESED